MKIVELFWLHASLSGVCLVWEIPCGAVDFIPFFFVHC